jgi:hypothetical protein
MIETLSPTPDVVGDNHLDQIPVERKFVSGEVDDGFKASQRSGAGSIDDRDTFIVPASSTEFCPSA